MLLLSAEGQSIRFGEDDVRVMGLPAGGVGGMKLRGKDRLVYAGVVDPDGELATVSVQGFAKRTALAEYSSQGRNGGGILAHKLVERTGKLGAGLMLPAHTDADNVVLVSSKGVAKPFTVADIPRMGRAASGKQILTLAEKDTVTAAWRVVVGAQGSGRRRRIEMRRQRQSKRRHQPHRAGRRPNRPCRQNRSNSERRQWPCGQPFPPKDSRQRRPPLRLCH